MGSYTSLENECFWHEQNVESIKQEIGVGETMEGWL
jgi:hypothetical protein